ncbi:MAG: exonuclease domain-containing protein [Acutalibacteraceae bacterium]
MNYIILDLEWDSAYSVKHKRFINQILQIGAVKLDGEFNVTDTFEETVKSSISKKVTGRFAALTGITTEKMLGGVPFDTAVDRYNAWVGENTVTMTWSDSDLYSIKENEECLLSGGRKFAIEKYLDLQKFVQGELRLGGYEDKNQISLGGAAELLGVKTDSFELHTAKDDSLLSVALLKKCYNAERFSALIRNTADPEFYKRLRFKPYNISDINDERINKDDLQFFCDKCGTKAKRITKWRYLNRWFTAKFECKECHRCFCGRITFKKTYDDLIVRKRVSEIKPKTEKIQNEMQPVSETV